MPTRTISCAIFHKYVSCIQPTGTVEPLENSQATYLNICSSLQNSSSRTIALYTTTSHNADGISLSVYLPDYGPDNPGIDSRYRQEMFLLPEMPTPTLGTTQGPFLGGKAARVWHSPLASTECLGEEWSYT
jgi:hypothetical protein